MKVTNNGSPDVQQYRGDDAGVDGTALVKDTAAEPLKSQEQPVARYIADQVVAPQSWGSFIRADDAGAKTAISDFEQKELMQDIRAAISGGKKNSVTGDEAVGVFIEGSADKGNEAKELGQIIGALQKKGASLTPAAERVIVVAEKYRELAAKQGGSLTQEQKAAMASEMSEAGKARLSDAFKKKDAGASEAIKEFDQNEKFDKLAGQITGKKNSVTGQEAAGLILTGSADKGNEAVELRQLTEHLKNQPNLDPAAKRVIAVAEKYQGIAAKQGGALTQQQKAELSKELSEASKPTLKEVVSGIGAAVQRPEIKELASGFGQKQPIDGSEIKELASGFVQKQPVDYKQFQAIAKKLFASDPGADSAIKDFKARETSEAISSWLSGKKSATTADEAIGLIIEGSGDKGNEARELGQLTTALKNSPTKLTPGAERAVAVAERYQQVAARQGGALTQEQKAQMAREMAEAGKPTLADSLQDAIGKLPPWFPGDLEPFKPLDAGASAAVQDFKKRETSEAIGSWLSGKPSRTTSDEAIGLLIEGSGDVGNEARELRQLSDALKNSPTKLTPGAERVIEVADKYQQIAARQGGSLTQEQKAQMAREMTEAGKARLQDLVQPFRA